MSLCDNVNLSPGPAEPILLPTFADSVAPDQSASELIWIYTI